MSAASSETYIWMNRWDEFQSFQKRRGKTWAPPWIKVYLSLLDEPAYLDLSPTTRCLLEGLWKLFARTRGTITKDTRRLSRQLNQRVTKQQLDSLNHAGWLDFCSGTVLEQRRNVFWNGSNLEVEEDKNTRAVPVSSYAASGNGDGHPDHQSTTNEQPSQNKLSSIDFDKLLESM